MDGFVDVLINYSLDSSFLGFRVSIESLPIELVLKDVARY